MCCVLCTLCFINDQPINNDQTKTSVEITTNIVTSYQQLTAVANGVVNSNLIKWVCFVCWSWGCLMSPSCLESQGCHLIPLSYLISCCFCLVLLLFLSCHCSANGPFSCLFSRKLKYFSLRVSFFCMALVEQLGDDSW